MGEFVTALLPECPLPVPAARRGRARDFSPLRGTPPLASKHRLSGRSGAWRSAVVTSLSAASDLLDELESLGVRRREFSILGESLYEIRWR